MIPSIEQCTKRCNEFLNLTKTDEVVAQYYLQENDWNLNKALNVYFKEHPSNHDNLKLLSWNINGLDAQNLDVRIKYILSIIKKVSLDVVLFQEVTNDILLVLKQHLSDYKSFGNQNSLYFTYIFYKSYMISDKQNFQNFETSYMDRGLSIVNLHIKNLYLIVMNTHLESTNHKKYKIEREKQFLYCLKEICDQISDKENCQTVVIWGGDLNIRDSEVYVEQSFRLLLDGGKTEQIPGLEMVDIWESFGSPSNLQFTYDPLRNNSISHFSTQSQTGNKGRHRFDRFYITYCNKFFDFLPYLDSPLNLLTRYSDKNENEPTKSRITNYFSPAAKKTKISTTHKEEPQISGNSDVIKIIPCTYELVGMEKMVYQDKKYQVPPSDHFGIYVVLKFITNK